MGTSFGQGVSEASSKMRAFIFVILAAAAMADSEPEADADAYTIGQVYAGLPLANAYASGRAHNPGVITGVSYGGYGGYGGYGRYGLYGGYYGKREADSEPEADADAYTLGQIAYGLPQANAYATGHPHNVGVITGVDYGYGRVSGYGAIGNRGIYGGFHHGAYAGYTGAYYG